ncbi:MAG TPA: decarboxylating 6-phosphogluconate dehydrogenase [Caulobacteraceae bacterium]|nr:decarboxylating 6-phosphogluconate dehydrogenase [Caulobacteraceae bacterium]
MQLGVIGMGRMGANIARRLMRGGHACIVYDRDAKAVAEVVGDGADSAADLADLVRKLQPPRTCWVMLPAGAPTDETVAELGRLMAEGDVVIDGGNSFYRDDIRRAKALAARGVTYLDIGTSGGVWGLERGYCMMVGGERAAVERIDPILKTLAPGLGDLPRTKRPAGADPRAELGYVHAGPVGAGHFVKMVHNGIEYGLMQAYAEGFDILKGKGADERPEDERFDLNLADVAEVWRRGSVISSWLLDLCAQALAGDAALTKYTGSVSDSGEGRWTLEAAIEQAAPADVLAAALFARFRSRQDHTFGERLLSAMRFGFGGHVEIPQ